MYAQNFHVFLGWTNPTGDFRLPEQSGQEFQFLSISMNNQLILLETIKSLSQGISQQQNLFVTDNLVNPLLPNVDNTTNPVVPNVENPEPVTLYHFASRKLRATI